MDSDKRQALSNFYREEFLRHLKHLESNGIVNERNRETIGKAYRKLTTDLDHVCWRKGFPVVAERLLRRFESLTKLSELIPRRGH